MDALRYVSATLLSPLSRLSHFVGARALTYTSVYSTYGLSAAVPRPAVFTPDVVPAEIVALNRELEAAALRQPPLSAGAPQAVRAAREAQARAAEATQAASKATAEAEAVLRAREAQGRAGRDKGSVGRDKGSVGSGT